MLAKAIAAGIPISSILFVLVAATMAPVANLHCLMPIAAAQGIPAPPPGNPGHPEPAPGVTCKRAGDPGVDADHACECHRQCKPNVDENGEVVPGEHVEENSKCRVYCYKSHCL